MDALEKSRHARRAAALCLVPGLGHLYIGEKRGYMLLLVSFILSACAWVGWAPAVWLYVGLMVSSMWDTYMVVQHDRGLL
jgi:hypothetical protein